MRTPEVEQAIRNAEIGYYRTGDADVLAAEVERLEDLHRMQLAGISTATLQNTVASTADRILKDNPYWTIAYGDVCTAVDREIAQRVRAEAAEARVAELEAQNARLREALEGLQSDAQCTLDLYNKNGPTWTSRDSGEEYYSASYVIDSTEERIATIKAALTDTKGTP